jgi:hypothetical protein
LWGASSIAATNGEQSVDRGHIDDDAAAARGDHLPGRQLRADEGRTQIGRQNLIENLVAHFQDRRVERDAGIVEHDVEPAIFGDGALDQSLDRASLRDVGRHENGACAFVAQSLGGRFAEFGVDVGECDRRAVGRQAPRASKADAVGRPGDDSAFAGQSCHTPTSVIASRRA